MISVDPRDANTLFAGGSDYLFRCTNCAASPTWTRAPPNGLTPHSDYHALEWAGNRLIAGNDGGVWSTADLGATWLSHNRTLRTLMFVSAALHPTDPSFVVGGFRDFPLTVYRPSTGWRVILVVGAAAPGAGAEAEVAVSSSHPDTDWMVAAVNGRIARTTDGGRTALRVDDAIDKSGTAWLAPVRKCPAFADMPFNVIAVDPRDTRLVYAGSDNGLWQSSDGGSSWTKVGLESGLPPASVYDIQINPATNKTVIFTYGRGAFELVR